jgi:hypothetical protein
MGFFGEDVRLVTAILLSSFVFGATAKAQVQEGSAAELIAFITYQSGRELVVAGTCGSFGASSDADWNASRSLVNLGSAALPDLEAAFDSIHQLGRQSKFRNNAGWLLLAYAKISGPEAFPALKKMRDDPNFSGLESDIDAASALSIGLTSFVSLGSRQRIEYARILHEMRGVPLGPCGGGSHIGPRDALDLLIFFWEEGDRSLLQEMLGPNARVALDKAVGSPGWDAWRAKLWRAKPDTRVVVGYLFEQNPWSSPATTLDSGGPTAEASGDLDLDTRFKDRSGNDCGRTRLHFRGSDIDLDNPDIVQILQIIGRCAANR